MLKMVCDTHSMPKKKEKQKANPFENRGIIKSYVP